MGSRHRPQRLVQTKEGMTYSAVTRRAERGIRVHRQTARQGVHLPVQVRTNVSSILRAEEGRTKADGPGLQVPKQAHNMEQLPASTHLAAC